MRHAKQFALCLATLLALSTSAYADRAGFYLGTNIAKFTSDPSIDATTDANFMFGGYAEFEVSPKFSVEPGLRYIEKGADISNYFKAQNNLLNSDAQFTRTARYFEVPLHFNYKFREDQSFRPYIFAGPALAFRIGDSTKQTGGSGTLLNLNTSDGLKSLDFSGEFGGGLELFFSENLSARFTAAYSLGFLDVNESTPDWKTRGLQVYAGMGFTF